MFCPDRRGMGHGVHGAFTQYAVARPDQLYWVPEGVSLEAAALVEPLAAAVHAVCEIARYKLGDIALVSGPGPIGLLRAQAVGCARYTNHCRGHPRGCITPDEGP